MTEEKIIYSIQETIRDNEINDDDKLTIAFLRNVLYAYRADALKDSMAFSEELFQPYKLSFQKKGNIYEALNMPSIIYDQHRYGISVLNFGVELSITSREEALNSMKGKFFNPPYVSFFTNQKLTIVANENVLKNTNTNNIALYGILNSPKPQLEINAVLVNPSQGEGYDWKKSNFPLNAQKISSIKQGILRREFGIMMEVKKDDVQNSRADRIIYQDESKLYK